MGNKYYILSNFNPSEIINKYKARTNNKQSILYKSYETIYIYINFNINKQIIFYCFLQG